jgi:hypothetical protein
MPIQRFIGNANFQDMACHVYALSGDHTNIANIHSRYSALGDYLIGRTALPAADATVPNGLTVVTSGAIRNAVADDHIQVATLGLLCTEFGLALQPGSGIRLWGHFEENQMLPEHMYVTYTNGNIYDTLPNSPVRRNVNNNGINPPAYDEGNFLDPGVIFSVEVAALAAGTMVPVNSADVNWANGFNP